MYMEDHGDYGSLCKQQQQTSKAFVVDLVLGII